MLMWDYLHVDFFYREHNKFDRGTVINYIVRSNTKVRAAQDIYGEKT